MVLGFGGSGGSGGGKKGRGQDKGKGRAVESSSTDKGKGKRAASKSASPPQAPPPPPQRLGTGKSLGTIHPTSVPRGMGVFFNSPSPPQAGPSVQRTGTGGSSSSTAAIQPAALWDTGGSSKSIQSQIKATSNVELRKKFGKASDNEQVWNCCECLLRIRENPPQYNRFGLDPPNGDLCWHVMSRKLCSHKKCGGCIVQGARDPPPTFMILYGTRLKHDQAPWVVGPWGNLGARAYSYFSQITFPREFPIWYCCQCAVLDSRIWNKPNTSHFCTKTPGDSKTTLCRHLPCRRCTLVPPIRPQASKSQSQDQQQSGGSRKPGSKQSTPEEQRSVTYRC